MGTNRKKEGGCVARARASGEKKKGKERKKVRCAGQLAKTDPITDLSKKKNVAPHPVRKEKGQNGYETSLHSAKKEKRTARHPREMRKEEKGIGAGLVSPGKRMLYPGCCTAKKSWPIRRKKGKGERGGPCRAAMKRSLQPNLYTKKKKKGRVCS